MPRSGTNAQTVAGASSVSIESAVNGAPPDSIAADINAAFMFTITTLGFTVSLAVLVFGGALEPGLPRAIGTFLVGNGLMAMLAGWRSQIVPVATYVQDAPAILMAAVATHLIAVEGATISDVFVLLVVTMLATSLATALLGHFGLGGLGRQVPRPVIDAFVGGLGLLLLKASFEVTTNSTLAMADLGGLFDWEFGKFWVTGLLIGLIAWLANRSQRAPASALGLVICTSLLGFYGVVVLASSVSAVESGGWLLGPFPETGGFTWVSPTEFRTANWPAIAKMAPGILGVVGITCIGQLFDLTGIRSTLVPQLNIDDELRTNACANLVASPFGVTPGFQALGGTLVLHRMGSTRRAVSLISGVLVIAFGIVGVAATGYVPRFIIGALLIMIGLALFEHWVRGLKRSTTTVERLVGAAIVATIAWFGLLQGVIIGLAAAGVVFIVSYSRVDPVRSTSNGCLVRSRVDRSSHEVDRLKASGDRSLIFELQGYLFFGSLTTLEDRVRQAANGLDAVETLVIDFANVTGVDGSGRALIAQLFQDLRHEGISIWVSSLDSELSESLLTYEPGLASHISFSPSLDAALESAEDRLLASTSTGTRQQGVQNQVRLSAELLSQCAAHRFQPGTVVLTQGAPSSGLLIVQRGRLTSIRVEPDGTHSHLRRFGEFSVVGESELIANTKRTANVVTEGVVDGWWLSTERYRELRISRPWLIVELHEFIIQLQSDRPTPTNLPRQTAIRATARR